jgi:hypothetical protein
MQNMHIEHTIDKPYIHMRDLPYFNTEGAPLTRIIVPPPQELAQLPTPLNEGEKRVLKFFDEHLPDEWEIYIQPHLNGLRPDFVLLHPKNGVAVYEVKDWDFDAVEYSFEGRKLFGIRDGRRFPRVDDPVAKARTYEEEIFELYCPSLPQSGGLGVITAGAVLPRVAEARLQQLFAGPYRNRIRHQCFPLVGRESLESGDIGKAFPHFDRPNANMAPDVARELRSWLVEPEVSREQRRPLELDGRQRDLVRSRTQSGYRRIRGPAGSGKSIVLAARAAQLASEGKDVLVVTFNITLNNYLRDLAVRSWRGKGFVERVTWLNFHRWCKRVASAVGERARYEKLWQVPRRDEVLNEKLAAFISELYDQGDAALPCYDAILVDEGQDYRLSWWNALRKSCRANGEMLLVADPTQDLYGTARAWTEQAMTGAGFPGGRWTMLNACYRLPPSLVPLARDFAQRFLPDDDLRCLPEPAQLEMPLARTYLRWIQVEDARAVDACVAEVLGLPSILEGQTLPWADIVFLAGTKAVGREVVTQLEGHGVRVIHTFIDDEKEERRRKLAFFKGDARLKATTIHSFKGWEGRALVIHLGRLASEADRAAAYAAITRLKYHEEASILSVVCSWDEGEDYGRTWPMFWRWGD